MGSVDDFLREISSNSPLQPSLFTVQVTKNERRMALGSR